MNCGISECLEVSLFLLTFYRIDYLLITSIKNLNVMKPTEDFEINYFQDEDGIFTAVVPAIRGCVASGKTLQEAYKNAIEAIESCLEAREKVASKKIKKPRYEGINIYRRPVYA
jgi:predicted RNase H-like HicB family nuclease